MSKYSGPVPTHALLKRAVAAGLPRAPANVLAIVGYWDQIDGGVIKDGLLWKWRPYDEMAADAAYSIASVQRAVTYLKRAGLVRVRRMYNPTRPGQTVSGFRVTIGGYEVLGLEAPADADAVPAMSAPVVEAPSPEPDGNDHYDVSLEQETFTGLQKTNKHVFGKEGEATMSAPHSPTWEAIDEEVTKPVFVIHGGSDAEDDDAW